MTGAIMKCEWVKENILLYVYNELADDARFELEQHLARCSDCTAELKTTRKFHAMLSELPVEEPSPNLAAAGSLCSRSGCSHLHRWFCRRHRDYLQDCERQRPFDCLGSYGRAGRI